MVQLLNSWRRLQEEAISFQTAHHQLAMALLRPICHRSLGRTRLLPVRLVMRRISDDPQTFRRKVQALLAQEESTDRQASEPWHLCHEKGGVAARARDPVFQTALMPARNTPP